MTSSAHGGEYAQETCGPLTVNLVENVERLKLDFEKILPLHGSGATKADLYKAAGKPNPSN